MFAGYKYPNYTLFYKNQENRPEYIFSFTVLSLFGGRGGGGGGVGVRY